MILTSIKRRSASTRTKFGLLTTMTTGCPTVMLSFIAWNHWNPSEFVSVGGISRAEALKWHQSTRFASFHLLELAYAGLALRSPKAASRFTVSTPSLSRCHGEWEGWVQRVRGVTVQIVEPRALHEQNRWGSEWKNAPCTEQEMGNGGPVVFDLQLCGLWHEAPRRAGRVYHWPRWRWLQQEM